MSALMKPFRLDFSNRVIEHLGIKLYQNKPTNVVAEFVSNSWDADASRVDVHLSARGPDSKPVVAITDDGRGMTRDELTDEFLIIGRNRRTNPGAKTPLGRTPMGRKGIGKLAGFGIAQTVDVVSCPNPALRDDGQTQRVYWLRFHLDALLAISEERQSSYTPEVIADGISIIDFEALVSQQSYPKAYEPLIDSVRAGRGGTCVFLSNTSLRKGMNTESLLQSMGRRFTVTLLRDDFLVCVNGKRVSPEDALPKLHPFSYGTVNSPLTEEIVLDGERKQITFWICFVDLQGSTDWSIDNAGVGVYAHGKIAQDRPFFFGVKGKEILSRYLYGVIEADWLDELPGDVVSTDRRSIDWDTPLTTAFHEWGATRISAWLEGFRKWRAQQPKNEIIKRIRLVTPNSKLSGTEEEALAELLSDILPNFADDSDAQDRATRSFTEAWTHAPTRILTQELWKQIFSSLDSDTAVFAKLVENLRRSMVPEAMGLAVTMAQRIAAITVFRRMIEKDQTETHLQRLIETFPWLLGPTWERLTANQTIRTLVKSKHVPDQAAGEWSLDTNDMALKPDFVFLSDPGSTKDFIVFELKGPEAGKNLQQVEYDQLAKYLRIIRGVYADQDKFKVRGVLVGHDTANFDAYDNRITVMTWSEVLLEARSLHVSYLKALLLASEPSADDIRLQQIADFGGKETMELLERLGPIGEFPEVIQTTLAALRDPD